VAISDDGNLYIASSQRIRRVGVDGIISTMAGGGTGTTLEVGDGGSATAAMLSIRPAGMTITADHSLFVADDSRVRRIWP
jgi:hypothetical protein